MFLDLHIASEDEARVCYWVETDYWDQSFMPEIKWVKVKGLCIFDKNTKTISFDSEQTDSFFVDRSWEPLMIEAHLKKIDKKQNGFPEEYHIATGG
ncbi:MAG: hypothetical protein AB7F19_01235 [Candidatus Babeliales bacterium]